MKIAIYPGSFDPITLGHLDIIRRAARCFDKVFVCVLYNCDKKAPMFSPEKRLEMIRHAVAELPNVEAELFGGLSGDLAGWFLQKAEFWMLAALVAIPGVAFGGWFLINLFLNSSSFISFSNGLLNGSGSFSDNFYSSYSNSFYTYITLYLLSYLFILSLYSIAKKNVIKKECFIYIFFKKYL